MAGSNSAPRNRVGKAKQAQAALTAKQTAQLRLVSGQERANLRARYLAQAATQPPPARAPARPRQLRRLPAPPSRRPQQVARPARAQRLRRAPHTATPAERATMQYKLQYARAAFNKNLPVPLPTEVLGSAVNASTPVSGSFEAIVSVAAGTAALVCFLPEQMKYPVRSFRTADAFDAAVSFDVAGDAATYDIESTATANDLIPATTDAMADWRTSSHPCAGYGATPVVGVYAGGATIGADTTHAMYYGLNDEAPRAAVLSGFVDITVSASQDAIGFMRVVDSAAGAINHDGPRTHVHSPQTNGYLLPSFTHRPAATTTAQDLAASVGELVTVTGGGSDSKAHRRLLITPTAGFFKMGSLARANVVNGITNSAAYGFYPSSFAAALANGFVIVNNYGSSGTLQVTITGAVMFAVTAPDGLTTSAAQWMAKTMSAVSQPFANAKFNVPRPPLTAPHQDYQFPEGHSYHDTHAAPAARQVASAERDGMQVISDITHGHPVDALFDFLHTTKDIATAGKDLLFGGS